MAGVDPPFEEELPSYYSGYRTYRERGREWPRERPASLRPPLDTQPCVATDTETTGPPLPVLDQQFEVRVEAKILQVCHFLSL